MIPTLLPLALGSPALAYDECPVRPGVLEQTACTEADPAACAYTPARPAGAYTRYPTNGNIVLVDADAVAAPPGGRTIPVIVRIPDGATGPMPVVILSHGGNQGVTNPATVMQEWFAELPRWGYVTVVVAHGPRNSTALCTALGITSTCSVGQPWDRPFDVATVIDWLTVEATRTGSPLNGKVDLERIGLLGHSAGASGASVMAGMKRVLGTRADGTPVYLAGADPRVKVIVPLSAPGPLNNGMLPDSFANVDVPFLVVSGAGDDDGDSITNYYASRAEMYHLADAPEQYRLFLDDLAVRHDTVNLKSGPTSDCRLFADATSCATFADRIENTVLGFLDAYLQCDEAAQVWLESDGPTVASGGWTEFSKRPAPDADGDRVVDTLDACPGFDDALNADGDAAPDGCDACPQDAANDRDGDGSCDSDDLCPLDPDDDADLDGACADLDPCPLDPDDDADVDGVCADLDPCPLDAANDADGDGVCGNDDQCPGADDRVDADGDSAPDACDQCPVDRFNDRDGDGSCDSDDPCPLDGADDADGDGACADTDPCPLDRDDDADLDGTCADIDPCPADPENDADGDGFCEGVDLCPTVADPSQSDADLDGIGDACEPDADADTVIDDHDNCPFAANADQVDLDADGVGDSCDADADGDAVPDGFDACLATAQGAPVLEDGCSLEQTCPCAAPWKNHGAYVSCVSHAATDLVHLGRLAAEDHGEVVSAAAASTCGHK